MTIFILGLALTAVLLATRSYRGYSAEFGTMSPEWMAACRLARPTSSL